MLHRVVISEIDLNNLKEFVSFNALHDSSVQDPERRCHPGTRVGVLKQITDWVEDSSLAERILWLHGPAGAGKSAIAQTISHLYSQGQVAATFFFFRSDPSRNDGNRLFPTLAWQIAISLPGTRMCIAQALTERPDVPQKAIETQFERLISFPLQEIDRVTFLSWKSLPVIVIDGVDECTNDKLQRRILKVIGNAVNDKRFPLRFLISSRSEAHISETIDQFLGPIRSIDLAKVDDSYRDIEKYLTEEFGRIAAERHIDAVSWPGQSVIEDFVFKSSGHFVYASTIIRFVGDEYNSATSQLDIVLGIKPNEGKSPYAELDALYLEILQRQPDQRFLRDFLSLLVFGHSESSDCAVLLNIDKEGLHRKLRGMNSLLKLDPEITPHHRSFFDFLRDLSRSAEYCISGHGGGKRSLELISDALVRIVTKVMQEPDLQQAEPFTDRFTNRMSSYPFFAILPLCDWEDALQPLLSFYDELLKSPWFTPEWKHDRCTAVCIIDDLLLHLAFYRGTTYHVTKLSQPQFQVQNEIVALEGKQRESVAQTDLDICISSLVASIQRGSPSDITMDLMDALLRFNHRDVVFKVHSFVDAQKLIDVIFDLVRTGCLSSRCDDVRRLYLLAFEVYTRSPVLPSVLFLNAGDVRVDNDKSRGDSGEYQKEPVKIWGNHNVPITDICHGVLVWGILSHPNIAPLLGICKIEQEFPQVFGYQCTQNGTLREWRQNFGPSVQDITQRILQVAKVIQYMHSFGIVLNFGLCGTSVFVDKDSNFDAKVPGAGLPLRYTNEATRSRLFFPLESYTYANDIRQFGCLYFEILFDSVVPVHPRLGPDVEITLNPHSPANIDDKAWELIQRCCSKDPPTIDDVIQEMESWV